MLRVSGFASNALIIYFILNALIENLLFERYIRPFSVDIALAFEGSFGIALNIALTTFVILLGIIYHLPFLILLRFAKAEKMPISSKIRLTPKRLIPPILITIGVYSALSFFTVPTYLFFRDLGIEFEVNTLLLGNEWFFVQNNIIQYIIVNILIEEFVFRQFILRRFTRFGDSFACLFVSTIYALCAESVMLIPLNFALSYILCFLSLRYKSVAVSIISRFGLMIFIIGTPFLISNIMGALPLSIVNNIVNGIGIIGGIVAAVYYCYKRRTNLRSYNGSLFFYDRIKISFLEFSFLCAIAASILVFVGDLRLW